MNDYYGIELTLFNLTGRAHMGLAIASTLLVTGLFFWGLLRNKRERARKILAIELLLVFLYWHLTASNICFSEMLSFLRAGPNHEMMLFDLSSYFARVFVVSSISLYKLILFLLLAVRKRPIKCYRPN